jgi:hypothetical protein
MSSEGVVDRLNDIYGSQKTTEEKLLEWKVKIDHGDVEK